MGEVVDTTDFYDLESRRQSLVKSIAKLRLEGYEYKGRGARKDMDGVYTAEEAYEGMEEFGAEPYSLGNYDPYTEVHRDYIHLVEEQIQLMANDREEYNGVEVTEKGQVRVEGEVDGRSEPLQGIKDRPVKSTKDAYLLPVDDDMLFRLIRSEDEELARWVFDQVVEEDDE